MPYIVESYKDTNIGHLLNVGTVYLLLSIVQCWRLCGVDRENRDLPMFLHCYGIMYKYYLHLGFIPIKK